MTAPRPEQDTAAIVMRGVERDRVQREAQDRESWSRHLFGQSDRRPSDPDFLAFRKALLGEKDD